MRAEGPWGWTNNYAVMPPAQIVERAKQAGLRGLILKVFDPDFEATVAECQKAGLEYAVENYVYPIRAAYEGKWLAEAYNRTNASFIVVNAEVEWETAPSDAMGSLLSAIVSLAPNAEIYASVDMRGGRNFLGYQEALRRVISGWMPMVYPLAFYPSRPEGYVESAFRDAVIDSRDGLAAFPTIQTYGDIGFNDVRRELEEVLNRGLPGVSFYTIEHATDEEWHQVELAMRYKGWPWSAPLSKPDLDVLLEQLVGRIKTHENRLDYLLWLVQDIQKGLSHAATAEMLGSFQGLAWQEYQEGKYERAKYPPNWDDLDPMGG